MCYYCTFVYTVLNAMPVHCISCTPHPMRERERKLFNPRGEFMTIGKRKKHRKPLEISSGHHIQYTVHCTVHKM